MFIKCFNIKVIISMSNDRKINCCILLSLISIKQGLLYFNTIYLYKGLFVQSRKCWIDFIFCILLCFVNNFNLCFVDFMRVHHCHIFVMIDFMLFCIMHTHGLKKRFGSCFFQKCSYT